MYFLEVAITFLLVKTQIKPLKTLDMIDNAFLLGLTCAWLYRRLTKLLKDLGMIDDAFNHTRVKLWSINLELLHFESEGSNFVHLMLRVWSETNLALSPCERD